MSLVGFVKGLVGRAASVASHTITHVLPLLAPTPLARAHFKFSSWCYVELSSSILSVSSHTGTSSQMWEKPKAELRGSQWINFTFHTPPCHLTVKNLCFHLLAPPPHSASSLETHVGQHCVGLLQHRSKGKSSVWPSAAHYLVITKHDPIDIALQEEAFWPH